jgi:hypothetical protein
MAAQPPVLYARASPSEGLRKIKPNEMKSTRRPKLSAAPQQKKFDHYAKLVDEIVAIFREAEAADKEVDVVNAAAPSGEARRLLGAELTARGLDSFSTRHPSIVKEATLPDFNDGAIKAWPPKPPFNAAMFAPQPFSPHFSAYWGRA